MATMPTTMIAEICFPHQNDLHAAMPKLAEFDFDIEVLDWMDDDGGALWVLASSLTELDQSGFLDFVNGIVDPFNGFVVEAGLNPRAARRCLLN